MFRKKLHKDLDGISPDEELLLKITKSMQEEAQKPRPKMYTTALRFGGMAAAVCMIAVGAIALNSDNSVQIANTSIAEEGFAYNNNKTAEAAGAAETTTKMQAEFYADETIGMESAESYTPSADSVSDNASAVYAEEAISEEIKAESINNSGSITLPEYKNKGIYETTVVDPAVSGAPLTLEEFMSDKERNKKINSFCRIKITDIISPEDAEKLDGWNENYGDTDAFFYNAVIEYDYFLGSKVNAPIIFRQSGLNYGSPAYAKDDTFAALIMDTENEITRLFSYAFIYDIYEIDGVSYGASRGQSVPEIESGLINYLGSEKVIYETTTPYNPAIYYGLFEMNELSESLKAVIESEISEQDTSAQTTHYTLSADVTHCSETGLSFDPNGKKVEIGFAIPSEWELSATVASLNGMKVFEICPPYPSSEVYNYESFKTDEVNGNEVFVHEEKYGTETDPFLYYIHVTVNSYSVKYSYSVKFYVINCGEYNLYLHFNADSGIDENTIYEIIRSVTVTEE